MKAKLHLLSIERIAKEKGAERISENAVKELKIILEDIIYQISVKASLITKHRKAKNINDGDIIIGSKSN